jgi:hypothetical protein
MGSLLASELASGIESLTLEQALGIHLRSNHYPPIPEEMVPVAVTAIHLANAGHHDALIQLPEGTEWRSQVKAPVWAIVDGLHLSAWLDDEEEE